MKSGRIIHIIVAMLFLLFFSGHLVINNDSIKQEVAKKIVYILRDALDTNVDASRISLVYPCGIIIDDLIIQDQRQDTLASFNSVALRIKMLPLLQNKFRLTSVRLSHPTINLSKDSINGKLNCQFLLDKFNSKEKTDNTGIDLRINSIIVKHGKFNYDISSEDNTPGIFNSNHINVNDFTASISLKKLESDSIRCIVRRLSLKEQSGFVLANIKGSLSIGEYFSNIHSLTINTLKSNIVINQLIANYGLLGTPKTDNSDLLLDVNSHITPSDFSVFYPQLASAKDRLSLQIRANGNAEELSISSFFLQSSKSDISISGGAKILNFEKFDSIKIDNGHLTTRVSSSLYNYLSAQLKDFNISIPHQIESVGKGSINLTFEGERDNYSAHLSANFIGGDITASIVEKDHHQTAIIDGKSINLQSILGNNDFSMCDLSLKADRQIEDSIHFTGNFDALISSFSYKDYLYSDIKTTGHFNQDTLFASLRLKDPNAGIQISTILVPDEIRSSCSISASLDSINLSNLQLANPDNHTSCSLDIAANLKGSDINDVLGSVSISNGIINNNNGSFKLDNLLLSISDLGEKQHIFSVLSDFVNLSIIGDYQLSSIPTSLIDITNHSLPSLHDWIVSKFPGYENNVTSLCNNFMIDLKVLPTDFFKTVLNTPLTIDNIVSLQCYINDCDSLATLDIQIPQLSYSDNHIDEGDLSLDSRRGICSVSLKGFYNSINFERTGINTMMTAFNDKITGYVSWDGDKKGIFDGSLLLSAIFHGFDSRNGWIKSDYFLDTTQFTINNVKWLLSPAELSVDSGKIDISHFNISHNNQYITANGTISGDSIDVLDLSIQDIHLDELLSMFHANELGFQGEATGDISIRSLLNKPTFVGELNVNNFWFYKAKYGKLNLRGNWDDIEKRVDVLANMTDSTLSSTQIAGYFDPQKRYIDFDINSHNTDLHFLDLYLSSIFKDISGYTTGRLRLFGPLSSLNLEGDALLKNAYLNQKKTNTTYIIKEDTLLFEPDKMIFKNVDFFDEQDHSGVLTCIITHHNFSNIAVDFDATLNHMQVYHKPQSDNSSIYVKAFADGSMRLIYNKKSGLSIKANVKTAPETQFGYNISSDNVSDYQFLSIVDRASQKEMLTKDTIVTSVVKSSSRVNLDIDVDCNEDADIQLFMSTLNGSFRGNGNILAQYNQIDGLSLNGIYNLSRGNFVLSVENLIRKSLGILDGSYVRFIGDPSDSELNLHTYHIVNSASIHDLDANTTTSNNVRARCLLDIIGQINNPELSFNVDIPQGTTEEKDILASAISTEEQRNLQFMYLLAVGRFYTFDYSNTDNANSTSYTSPMESLVNSTVNTQINKLLSQVINTDIISLSSNVSAGSYLAGDATSMVNKEFEGILEARLLNNRLLFNGNFGYRENTLTNSNNFIGDFEVQWLLFPKYGISLKGYNKNNDKYFSKTTLTTQGVGMVYEKDFDRILPRRKTKKTKRK